MIWRHKKLKNQQKPPRPPKATAQEAELLRYKVQLEDEIKHNYPDQRATNHFYNSWMKPYRHQKIIEKEPDEPP